jgi:epoxyqueuosine reductase
METTAPTTSVELTKLVKSAARSAGFDLVGITPAAPSQTIGAYAEWIDRGFHGEVGYLAEHLTAKRDPRHLLPSAQSIVMVGLNYYQAGPTDPKIARYALGRDYHRVIRSKLKTVAAVLPGESRICVDSAPLLEREYAHRAGLGWFGKNTLLINSQRGSWFLLGALLSSDLLEPDEPSPGGCGTCRACIDACPTGAIVNLNERWQVDARACISYQTIERRGPEIGETHGWLFGCDVCQEVCPFNTIRESQPLRSSSTQVPDFAPRPWPTATEILSLSEPAWDQLTAGSPVRRSGFDGLKRNARKVLAEG